MMYYLATPLSKKTWVTEEQFGETYLASPTYFERVAKAKELPEDERDAALEAAKVPTDFANGFLHGRIVSDEEGAKIMEDEKDL